MRGQGVVAAFPSASSISSASEFSTTGIAAAVKWRRRRRRRRRWGQRGGRERHNIPFPPAVAPAPTPASALNPTLHPDLPPAPRLFVRLPAPEQEAQRACDHPPEHRPKRQPFCLRRPRRFPRRPHPLLDHRRERHPRPRRLRPKLLNQAAPGPLTLPRRQILQQRLIDEPPQRRSIRGRRPPVPGDHLLHGVVTDGQCSPRREMHFESSFIQFYGII